ncbi:MAG: Hsp20/alpha crystallin family protein [Deltaproteobacteria bacterium]|nr:MAG: Hsp20/alpha crystallin family protein [Deltaproteobacteria bacterium]
MTSLIRYRDPFEMVDRFFNTAMPSLFDTSFPRLFDDVSAPRAFTPAFDVEETDEAYILRADMPGVDEKDIEVTVVGDTVVISGKREVERTQEANGYRAYERSYGTFRRSIAVPGADFDAAEATLDKGVLTVTLPKRAEAKPRKIPLKGIGSKVKGLFGKKDKAESAQAVA